MLYIPYPFIHNSLSPIVGTWTSAGHLRGNSAPLLENVVLLRPPLLVQGGSYHGGNHIIICWTQTLHESDCPQEALRSFLKD